MSFKAINWTPNEVISERKMDQVADNSQWLYNNTPRAIYTLPGGLRRTEGIKIAAGRVVVAKRMKSDLATVTVRFGNFFSTRCEPIITTGIVSARQPRIFCVINGIGGKLQPDHRGFNARINIMAEKKKNDKIVRSFHISWQAMGY